MPLKTYFIADVQPCPGRTGTRFDVVTRIEPPLTWAPLFYTYDALKAAACERAQRTGRAVTLGTRDTKYGEEIVTVELVQEVA